MEVIICIIALIIINWNIWDQQIQALKARLEALEPKDEVETFVDKEISKK